MGTVQGLSNLCVRTERQAVARIGEATQQNAALVEQSAASVKSLKEQAQQLVQAISVFRLSDEPQYARVA